MVSHPFKQGGRGAGESCALARHRAVDIKSTEQRVVDVREGFLVARRCLWAYSISSMFGATVLVPMLMGIFAVGIL